MGTPHMMEGEWRSRPRHIDPVKETAKHNEGFRDLVHEMGAIGDPEDRMRFADAVVELAKIADESPERAEHLIRAAEAGIAKFRELVGEHKDRRVAITLALDEMQNALASFEVEKSN